MSSARSSFGVICDVFSSRSVYLVIRFEVASEISSSSALTSFGKDHGRFSSARSSFRSDF